MTENKQSKQPTMFDNVVSALDASNFLGQKIIITICCVIILLFWFQPLVYQARCEDHGLLFLYSLSGKLSQFGYQIRTQSGHEGMSDGTVYWFVLCGVIVLTTWLRTRHFNVAPSVLLVLSTSFLVLTVLIESYFCFTWFNLTMFIASCICLAANRHLDKMYKKIDRVKPNL